jgi:N-acetylmuramoyl-L-alanine amidase
MTTITIDPGHGRGRAGGSSGPGVRGGGGTLEKDVTLDLARRLQRRLGARAVLTRVSDANISLAARAHAARQQGSRVFLSLHANEGGRGERGAETLIHTRAGQPSLALARTMQAALARLGAPDRGIKRAELALLTPEQLPEGAAACLVEVDYLSDPAGEARLRDPRALDDLSAALAAGVDNFLGRPATGPRLAGHRGNHERYGRGEPAAATGGSVGVALKVPDWDLPGKFPAKIATFWAGRHHRLLHEYWHAIRQKGWAGLTPVERTDASTLGFTDPGRTRTDPGWGVDFFCMHRHMIETTRAAAKKVGGSYRPTGWDPVPWDHTDKVWPMPIAPSFAGRAFKEQGSSSTPGTTDYWKDQVATRYRDDDWLSQVGSTISARRSRPAFTAGCTCTGRPTPRRIPRSWAWPTTGWARSSPRT